MKRTGHVSIGTKIIHLCPEIFAESLSKVFNQTIFHVKYILNPSAMKISNVIVLFKGGIKGNPNTNNYRLISLLCHFHKILEKLYAKDALPSYLGS